MRMQEPTMRPTRAMERQGEQHHEHDRIAGHLQAELDLDGVAYSGPLGACQKP